MKKETTRINTCPVCQSHNIEPIGDYNFDEHNMKLVIYYSCMDCEASLSEEHELVFTKMYQDEDC